MVWAPPTQVSTASNASPTNWVSKNKTEHEKVYKVSESVQQFKKHTLDSDATIHCTDNISYHKQYWYSKHHVNCKH